MANLNLNKVIIGGRMCADPELKKVGEFSFVTFTVAVNRARSKDGETQADFIRCAAWRKTAEFICNYFRKGSSICVVGQLQIRRWQDKEGANRESAEIVVDEALFVDSRGESSASGDSVYIPDAYTKPAAMAEIKADDDLPF
jgi:single-strand DNA-binding protein